MDEQYIANLIDQAGDQNEKTNFTKEIYKYWFKTKDRGGFLSITPWFEANKVTVDVGEIKDGKVSSTKVFTNMMELYCYLTAVSDGVGPVKYPGDANSQPETYTGFGGGTVDGNPVSRILKIEHWGNNDNRDTRAFAWKTGHFKGRRTDSGAILPMDMGSPLSMNFIKIARLEMDKIQQLLHFAIQAYATAKASEGKDWWDWT